MNHIDRAAEVIEHALSRHGEHGTYLDAARALAAAGLLAKYPHLEVEGDWLIEVVNYHTCGAGPGSGAGHEPGCGTIPVGRLAAPEHDAAVYVRELRADADAAEAAGVIDAAIRDYHTARKHLLDVILDACPRHLPLDQEDGRRHWCKRCGRTTFGELIGEVGK